MSRAENARKKVQHYQERKAKRISQKEGHRKIAERQWRAIQPAIETLLICNGWVHETGGDRPSYRLGQQKANLFYDERIKLTVNVHTKQLQLLDMKISRGGVQASFELSTAGATDAINAAVQLEQETKKPWGG